MKFLRVWIGVGALIALGCSNNNNNSNGTGTVSSSQQVQGHWAVSSFQTRNGASVPPDYQGFFNEVQIDGQNNGRFRYYVTIDPTNMTFTQIDDQGDGPADDIESYSVQNGTFISIAPGGAMTHMTLVLSGQNTLDVRGESGIIGHYSKLTDQQYAQIRAAVAASNNPGTGQPNMYYPNVGSQQGQQQQQQQQQQQGPQQAPSYPQNQQAQQNAVGGSTR
jgi:hypothetical protein